MELSYLLSLSSITCKQEPQGGIGSLINPLTVLAVTATALIGMFGYLELA